MRFNFCPNCGSELTRDPTDAWAPQPCARCSATHYHNAKPCAGALVIRDGCVLLVKRAVEPFKDWWDIPGGFLQARELPADGAVREVLEETGLRVRVIGLHGIYLDRYGEDGDMTLNIYFLAEVVGGKEHARDDVQALHRFSPNALPPDIAFVHARQVLEDWCAKDS
jgi:ADP-ribose pyrophosphatase YjhB (NUDIX family)